MATGWQVGFGNSKSGIAVSLLQFTEDLEPVGGIIAAYSFLSKDAPRYTAGYSICIAFICMSALTCGMYFVGIIWENRQRDRGLVKGVDLPFEEKQKMGDLNPDYRYLL